MQLTERRGGENFTKPSSKITRTQWRYRLMKARRALILGLVLVSYLWAMMGNGRHGGFQSDDGKDFLIAEWRFILLKGSRSEKYIPVHTAYV